MSWRRSVTAWMVVAMCSRGRRQSTVGVGGADVVATTACVAAGRAEVAVGGVAGVTGGVAVVVGDGAWIAVWTLLKPFVRLPGAP